MAITLIAFTRNGVAQAAALAAHLDDDSHLLLPTRFRNLLDNLPPSRVTTFDGAHGPHPLATCISERFQTARALIFIGAVGIAVRLIAPHLHSKQTDPAVLVLDEAGRFVIPICSGHLGGANALALHIGARTGATPVITTASDTQGTIAVDLLGQELGWRVEASAETLLRAASAVVNGEPVVIIEDDCGREWWPDARPLPANLRCVPTLEQAGEAAAYLWVTRRAIDPAFIATLGAPLVLYRPPETLP